MENDVSITIGCSIKKYRKQKKLTQQQLGELLNVSQAMIAQYEKGLRHPKIETLRKIANVLDVKLTNFLENNQTIIDDWEDDMQDSLTKDADGKLIRKICTVVDMKKIVASSINVPINNIIDKLGLLNTAGQLKANDYISDLIEQEKYLKKPPN